MFYLPHVLFLLVSLTGLELQLAAETVTDFLRGRPDLSEVIPYTPELGICAIFSVNAPSTWCLGAILVILPYCQLARKKNYAD